MADHAPRNNWDTFWEMRPQVILSCDIIERTYANLDGAAYCF